MYFETVYSIYSPFNRHSSPFSARLPNYLHVHIIIACDEEDVTSKLVNRTYEKCDENAKEKDYLLGRGVCMCVCVRDRTSEKHLVYEKARRDIWRCMEKKK